MVPEAEGWTGFASKTPFARLIVIDFLNETPDRQHLPDSCRTKLIILGHLIQFPGRPTVSGRFFIEQVGQKIGDKKSQTWLMRVLSIKPRLGDWETINHAK